jgi:uncharacterized protein (UPF0218 family)
MLLKNALTRFYSEHIKQSLVIQGEEDLLTLPAILLAPLNSFVFYGQYKTGMICVTVTEEKKNEIVGIIKKFRQKSAHKGL